MNCRILFINFSFREKTDNFFPYAVYSLMSYLKNKGGISSDFYNIDLLRPSRQEAIEYIVDYAPDILAISSPVSTGYESCKYYSKKIKEMLPNTKILLGGNLAASADIILKKTGVDFCFLGEGEKSLLQFVQLYINGNIEDEVSNIQGISYLDDGKLVINGYGKPLGKDYLYNIDFDLIEDKKTVDHYFSKIKEFKVGSAGYRYLFNMSDSDSRDEYKKLREKRVAIILTSRGCVSRCTFCHRFVEGIRILPVLTVISRVKFLIENYDVAAFLFSDECFGVDNKWLIEFCHLIGELNVIWKVSGMRVSSVDPSILQLMHKSGCRSIIYGMESGSQSILNIMEKKTTVEQGVNAIKWTYDVGMSTVIQLVIGMPGETISSFKETEQTLRKIGECHKFNDVSQISVNFTQALPGTPVYEYARSQELIGISVQEEEEYLLRIADTNAADWSLNLTNLSDFELEYWKVRLQFVMKYSYINKFGINCYHKIILGINSKRQYIKRLLTLRSAMVLYPNFIYKYKYFMFLIALKRLKKSLFQFAKEFFYDMFVYTRTIDLVPTEKSLRKSLEDDINWKFKGEAQMVQLRKGNTKSNNY